MKIGFMVPMPLPKSIRIEIYSRIARFSVR